MKQLTITRKIKHSFHLKKQFAILILLTSGLILPQSSFCQTLQLIHHYAPYPKQNHPSFNYHFNQQ